MNIDYFISRVTAKTFDVKPRFKADYQQKVVTGQVQGGYHTDCKLIHRRTDKAPVLTVTTDISFIIAPDQTLLKSSFATGFHVLNKTLIYSGVNESSVGFVEHLYDTAISNAYGVLANRLEEKNLPVPPITYIPISTFQRTITDFLSAHQGGS